MTLGSQVSVTDARGQLADLVNRVAYTGEQVTLTRHGRPMAVLVSVADAERARGALDEKPDEAEVLSPPSRTLELREPQARGLDIAARTPPPPPRVDGSPRLPLGHA